MSTDLEQFKGLANCPIYKVVDISPSTKYTLRWRTELSRVEKARNDNNFYVGDLSYLLALYSEEDICSINGIGPIGLKEILSVINEFEIKQMPIGLLASYKSSAKEFKSMVPITVVLSENIEFSFSEEQLLDVCRLNRYDLRRIKSPSLCVPIDTANRVLNYALKERSLIILYHHIIGKKSKTETAAIMGKGRSYVSSHLYSDALRDFSKVVVDCGVIADADALIENRLAQKSYVYMRESGLADRNKPPRKRFMDTSAHLPLDPKIVDTKIVELIGQLIEQQKSLKKEIFNAVKATVGKEEMELKDFVNVLGQDTYNRYMDLMYLFNKDTIEAYEIEDEV